MAEDYEFDEPTQDAKPSGSTADSSATSAGASEAPKIEFGQIGNNYFQDLSIFLGGGRAKGVLRTVAKGVTYGVIEKGTKPPKSLAKMLWEPAEKQTQAYELPFDGDPTDVLTLEEFARKIHGDGFPVPEFAPGKPPQVDPALLDQLDHIATGLVKLTADLHSLGCGLGTAHPRNILWVPNAAGGRRTFQVLLPDLGFVYTTAARRFPEWMTSDEYEYLPLWSEPPLQRQVVKPLRSADEDLRVLARLLALLLRGRFYLKPGQPEGKAVSSIPGPDQDKYTGANIWHVLQQAESGRTAKGEAFTAKTLLEELGRDENRPSLHFTAGPATVIKDTPWTRPDNEGRGTLLRKLLAAGVVGLVVLGLGAAVYFNWDYFNPKPLQKVAEKVPEKEPEVLPADSQLAPLVAAYKLAKTPAERSDLLKKMWRVDLSRDRALREQELGWREHLRNQYRLDWERRYTALANGTTTSVSDYKDGMLELWEELRKIGSDPDMVEANEQLRQEEKRCLSDLEADLRMRFPPDWCDEWFSGSPP